ncbi:MAG: hypothetical protein JWM87_760 [Candidatus Eremiobacteraeota bacterium]|nr:hypothetical protein [Candidatus Eremiobacteraeota bacterium]
MAHVVDSLICRDYGYAWRAGWRWVLWYARYRRFLAALRTVWYTLILGHIGEACRECGRPYLHWWAADDLYASATGKGRRSNGEAAPGLYCLECFDRKALAQGIKLRWIPERWTP